MVLGTTWFGGAEEGWSGRAPSRASRPLPGLPLAAAVVPTDRQHARPEQDARAGAPFPKAHGAPMYIGIGTLVFILLVLMIIYFLRRA